jgi:ABC-type branched-subunit amino acid transport system substrate-binding protein
VLGDRAEVGQHADAAVAVAAAQLQRLGGIVGDRERAQLEIADRDRLAVAGEAQARGATASPSARQVPRLIQTGRSWRSASATAQPTWSLCS